MADERENDGLTEFGRRVLGEEFQTPEQREEPLPGGLSSLLRDDLPDPELHRTSMEAISDNIGRPGNIRAMVEQQTRHLRVIHDGIEKLEPGKS